MRKLAVAATAMLLAIAPPAAANNDPTVPADECSGNPKAVGQPFGQNATDTNPSQAGGPASANNPGQSTGAKGQDNSEAEKTGNCTG